MGPSFKVSQERGVLLPSPLPDSPPVKRHGDEPVVEPRLVATIHPSAILRAPDRDEVYAGPVADLRIAATALAATF